MKRIFAIIASAAMLGSCSNGTKYTIKGTDESFEHGKYAYLYLDGKTDSVLIADNSFEIKGGVSSNCPCRQRSS